MDGQCTVKKRSVERIRFLIVLIFCGIALLMLRPGAIRPPSREQLLNAASGADRLVISSGDSGNFAPAEIRGEEAVQDFLAVLGLDLPPFKSETETVRVFKRCGCDGDYHIDLYRGKDLLVSIGYHHNKMIRWRNGPWDTDVDLSPAAKTSVPEWFRTHGFPAMREKYEAEEREQQLRQQAERP